MAIFGIGIDVLDIKRFRPFRKDKKNRFLTTNFSPEEISYCFSFKDPVPHLAGTFAAKEAVFKTLGLPIHQSSIEIRREHNAPTVWIKNRKKNVLVSISHTDTIATAIALKI